MKLFPLILMALLINSQAHSQNLDLQLLNSLHVKRDRGMDGAMNAVTYTTYPIVFAVPVGQFLKGLAEDDPQLVRMGWQSVTSLALATGVTYAFKYAVRRDRPYEAHAEYQPYEYSDSYSFSSGHTAFAFATATNLSREYKRWYVVVPAFTWAAAVGYSRIHLGSHYPSDVVAGAVVGVASSYICFKGNQWLQGQRKKKTVENPF